MIDLLVDLGVDAEDNPRIQLLSSWKRWGLFFFVLRGLKRHLLSSLPVDATSCCCYLWSLMSAQCTRWKPLQAEYLREPAGSCCTTVP
jgi:hypothetical protein